MSRKKSRNRNKPVAVTDPATGQRGIVPKNVQPFKRLESYILHLDSMMKASGYAETRKWALEHPYVSRNKTKARGFQRTVLSRAMRDRSVFIPAGPRRNCP